MDLCVWDKCNNRCLMCTNPQEGWPTRCGSYDYGFRAIKERMVRDKEEILKQDSIYLSGGEPTIHPDFLSLLRFLKEFFPRQRIKLLTNGRNFFYPEFTRKVLSINNNFEIDLSLHGPTKSIHEKVTRAENSYEQATRGLSNLLAYKNKRQEVGIRYVLTGLNYKHLCEFYFFIAENFPKLDRLIFIFWEIEAQAIENFNNLDLSYRDVKKQLDQLGEKYDNKVEIRLYHFPLCVLPASLWDKTWVTLDPEDVTCLSSCQDCNYKKYCLGIPKYYLEKYGDGEFYPLDNFCEVSEGDNPHKPINKINLN